MCQICIKAQNGQLVSDVFRKQTNDGKLLNAISECPGRYKSSVIISGICRVQKICSTRELFNQVMKRFKQILVNNGYTKTEFEYELEKFRGLRESPQLPANNNNKINIYYKNYMILSYKTDERIILNIVRIDINVTNDNDYLNLIIYYKSPKTAQLAMKNNTKKRNS